MVWKIVKLKPNDMRHIQKTLLGFLYFLTSVTQADQVSGQMISANCFTCHGTEGRFSSQSFRSLARLTPEEIATELLAFKYGKRPATIMDRIAKGYSDEAIRATADYFTYGPNGE